MRWCYILLICWSAQIMHSQNFTSDEIQLKIDGITTQFSSFDDTDSTMRALLMLQLSWFHDQNEDPTQAVIYAENAKRQFEQLKNKPRIAESAYHLGFLYDKSNLQYKSINSYCESLMLYKSLNMEPEYETVLSKLSEKYFLCGDWSKVIEVHSTIIDKHPILVNYDDSVRVATSLYYIGYGFEHQGKLLKAVRSFDRSNEISQNFTGNNAVKCLSQLGSIRTNLKIGQVKQAQSNFIQFKALTVCHGIEYKVDSLIISALLYIHQAKYDQAYSNLEFVAQISKEEELPFGRGLNLFDARVLLEQKRQGHEKICSLYKDLITDQHQQYLNHQLNYLTNTEANFKLEKELADNKVKFERKKLRIERKEVQTRRNWTFLTIGIILLALTLITFLFNRQGQRLNDLNDIGQYELERKQRIGEISNVRTVLAQYGLSLGRNQQCLTSVKTKITELLNNPDDPQQLEPIIVMLDNHIRLSPHPTDMPMGDIDHSFQKKLEAQYPTLTSKDQALCAQILSGLSTKEIAERKSKTIGSVEKSRYRLRKKLGIPSSESLTSYLKSI